MYQFIASFGRGYGMQTVSYSLSYHLSHNFAILPTKKSHIKQLDADTHTLPTSPSSPSKTRFSPEQSALGVSLAVFGQTFGGSLFLDFANLVFDSGVNAGLSEYAPTVDAQAVTAAGATAFREVVAKESLPGILRACSLAVDHAFLLDSGRFGGHIRVCLWNGVAENQN